MTKDDIIALFNDDIETKQRLISSFVMDKENSFEDRLTVWKTCPNHIAPLEPYSIDMPNFEKKYGEIVWYNDFYLDRYEIFDLRNVDGEDQGWEEEKLMDFITECMDNGYFKFRMDW